MNHLGDIAQLITAIAILLNALATAGSYIQSWRNGKKADSIAMNVGTIEKATNSMKDALVAATAKAALAEGTAVGLEQGRSEVRLVPKD
jgi:hypothetical protein